MSLSDVAPNATDRIHQAYRAQLSEPAWLRAAEQTDREAQRIGTDRTTETKR